MMVLILAVAVAGVIGFGNGDRTIAASPAVGSQASSPVDAPGAACAAVARLVGTGRDSGPALQACLDAAAVGATVTLPPGRYRIATPVRIQRPVTLTTRGLARAAPPCFADERRCAVFDLAIGANPPAGAVMPFDLTSDAVRIDHLVFVGTRLSDAAGSAKRCATDKERPLAGGLRVSGNAVMIVGSVFRDMACYTALEYGNGVGTVIRDNAFVGNGTHNAQLRWADGLTIHTAQRMTVTGNRFRDNTDVQLIFGSCVDCTIANNRFDHSGTAAGGAFAEIMLQAWPKATSGDFSGTHVTRNTIDCGAQRRCGFGIMIGSAPWYAAPAFGGAVTANRVRGAMLALNVDSLTGPMVIKDNDLVATSGIYPSMCGPRHLPAITTNISPASRPYLPEAAFGQATSTHYCILNFSITAP